MNAETPTTQKKQAGVQRRYVAVVDRANTDKTRRVKIEYLTRHPKYGKYLKNQTILVIHDEHNASGVGDKVEIMPCKPMSKTKRWKLVRVLEKGIKDVDVEATIATPQV